jgi:hypothetical protein
MSSEMPIIGVIQMFKVSLGKEEEKEVFLHFLGDIGDQKTCATCGHMFFRGMWSGDVKTDQAKISIKRCPICERIYV